MVMEIRQLTRADAEIGPYRRSPATSNQLTRADAEIGPLRALPRHFKPTHAGRCGDRPLPALPRHFKTFILPAIWAQRLIRHLDFHPTACAGAALDGGENFFVLEAVGKSRL